MNNVKLSHSAIETYRLCGEKYRLHYIEKIREDLLSSALIFGSALDEAEEVLLLRKKDNLNKSEIIKSKSNPYEVFKAKLTWAILNGRKIYVPTSEKVFYYKNDLDTRLLTKEDIEKAHEFNFQSITIPKNKDEVELFCKEHLDIRNNPDWLTIEEIKLFNYYNYCSIKNKGILLLKEYENKILPKIIKVYSVQKSVKLINDEGDVIKGYLDFVAEWEGEGKVVFDNKTSSRKYGPNSVKESQQLIIYSENEEHFKAGFIVLLKNIKYKKQKTCTECDFTTNRRIKRCENCNSESWEITEIPQAEIQVLIDELDNELQDKTFDEIVEVAQNIKQEKFEKNFDACFQFGRKCAYYDICHNNKMNDNLIKLKDYKNGKSK